MFSDFALVSRIKVDLYNLFPRAADLDTMLTTALFDDADAMMDGQRIEDALYPVRFDVQVAIPISTKLYYSVDKAYIAINVEAVRRTEANLDTIWGVIDAHFSERHGETLHQIRAKRTS